MFRKTMFYRRFILPVLVDLLKLLLWIMEPVLPDAMIDDAEELIALQHGPELRMPVRIQRIARKLSSERRQQLYDAAAALLEAQENETGE